MKIRNTFLLLLLLHPFHLLAQVDLKKLDAYLAKSQNEWGVPGMSVGVVKDGKLIFAKGYGTAEMGTDRKVDENTLYAIASNSKAFTSTAIALLVQEGKLSWNDPVQKYLPYFKLNDPTTSSMVTIKDLLCHRVGLGTFSGDIIWHRANRSVEDIIKHIQYLEPEFGFRDGFGYSNLMYITAGEVIKVVSGQDWGTFVTNRLLKPLDMNRSVYQLEVMRTLNNVASPHELSSEGVNRPIEWVDWETVGATGGLISSVKDMSQWAIFNLNNGIWGKDTLLTRSSRNTLWTPYNTFGVDHTNPKSQRNFSGYALGWQMSDYYSHLRVSHTGGYDGMLSAFALYPDDQLAVIVLTNGLKAPIGSIPNYIADRFFGLAEKDWSKDDLKNRELNEKKDTRIVDRKKARVLGTIPALEADQIAGKYKSDIYGNIEIKVEKGELRISFEHTPDYTSTLKHWHYDTYEIVWDKPQAWFQHGTVKVNYDNNMKVIGLDFDVPNDDIFFEELKPIRLP